MYNNFRRMWPYWAAASVWASAWTWQVWNISTTVYVTRTYSFWHVFHMEAVCRQLTVHLVAVVTAPWWWGSVGWEGSVGRRWTFCSCCALLGKEMSCADPSNARKNELCTPMAGGWFCPDPKRLRLREGERRKSAPPNCLIPGTREVESLQTSHQPSLHCI